MNINDRDKALIQGFLDGHLTSEEEAEVSYRLKEEPELQRLLSEYDTLAAGIQFAHRQEKLQQLRSLEAGLPPVDEKVISLRSYLVPFAAAAAILVSLSIWYFMSGNLSPADNQALFAEYFEPFDSPGNGMTRSTDDEMTLKAKAYRAYDSRKYEEAATLFVAVLNEKDDAIVHLCLGNTWLALGNADEAEKVFQHVLESHGDLVTHAKWYLALTFLKQGKLERTKATLWEISNSSTYGNDARKLLKRLD